MSKIKSVLEKIIQVFKQAVYILAYIFTLAIWAIDRVIHVILWHKNHERLGKWSNDINNLKFAIARIIILLTPYLLYKALT